MSSESMAGKLARVVELRAWRERQAQRALCEQRDALDAAKWQAELERQALRRIEDSARQAREQLCATDTPLKATDANGHLAYAASRRHQARGAALIARRAEADVVQAQARVDGAREAWQQRARAHSKMCRQHDELVRDEQARTTRRGEEASADEHLDGWIARQAGANGGAP
jgi:hypothetical protein